MRSWAAPSELWLQRMIEVLEPHIAVIACRAPVEPYWRGRIPASRIYDRPSRVHERLLDRVGFHRLTSYTAESQLEALIHKKGITRIFAHYLHYALEFESLWKRLKIPIFVHSHGVDMEWDITLSNDPAQRKFPPDYRSRVVELSKRATIITNSKISAAKLYAAGIQENRVIVKYYGVPQDSPPPRRHEAYAELNVLYLGRLVDFKGPDLVMHAFNRACDLGFRGNLTIAGDGAMRPACDLIRNQSAYRDRIKMLGIVDAATGVALRAAADIFTAHNHVGPVSGREEALGVSILEAMSCGLPVITGRSGGVLETVVHEETGLLITPGDVEEHAAAFLKLEREPSVRLAMGSAAIKQVQEKFSLEREKQHLISILGLNQGRTATTM